MLVSPKRYGSEGPALELVTWADGTDEEIKAMIDAADAGEVNLTDYWSVGDERTVSLAAMTASGSNSYGSWSVGETHAAQDVVFVLMNEGYNVTDCDNSHVQFVAGMKNCLNESGYINSYNSTSGGWKDCARRAWCNSAFRASIPDSIRSIFKQFSTKTYNSGGTPLGSVNTTQDYFALFAGKEIFNTEQSGSASSSYPAYSGGYSVKDEADNLSQITYYATNSNRIKKGNGTNSIWWLRSPCYNGLYSFCAVTSTGGANDYGTSNRYGLATFGCI